MLKLTFAIVTVVIILGISVLMEGHNFFVSVVLATIFQIAAVAILYLIYTVIHYNHQASKKMSLLSVADVHKTKPHTTLRRFVMHQVQP